MHSANSFHRRRCLLALGLGLTLFAASCSTQQVARSPEPALRPPEPSTREYAGTDVLVSYRGGQLLRSEAEAWAEWRKLGSGPESLHTAARELILLQVLAAEAEAAKLHEQPVLQGQLLAQEEQRLQRTFGAWVTERVELSEEDIDEALATQPEAYYRPNRWRLYNLFQRWPESGSASAAGDALRASMAELRQRAVAGEDFQQLARSESHSQTRFKGGLMGNVRLGQLRPQVDRVLQTLQAGDISPLVETEDGITLFYCEAVLPAVSPSPAEQRQLAAKTLRTRAIRRAWRQTQEQMLAAAGLEMDLSPARLNSADAEEVATFEDGVISLGELRALVGKQELLKEGTQVVTDEQLSALREALQRRAFRTLAARRARELALVDHTVERELAFERLRTLAAAALAQRVGARLPPLEEAEIRQFFDDNTELFRREAHYRLAAIRVRAEGDELLPAYRQLDRLAEALRESPEGFAAAAEEHSDHPSATRGGDLGWRSYSQVGMLGPQVWRVARTLRPGQVSSLVQQDDGLWILRLLDRQSDRAQTYAEARERVENRLGNLKAKALQQEIEAAMLHELQLRWLHPQPAGDASSSD